MCPQHSCSADQNVDHTHIMSYYLQWEEPVFCFTVHSLYLKNVLCCYISFVSFVLKYILYSIMLIHISVSICFSVFPLPCSLSFASINTNFSETLCIGVLKTLHLYMISFVWNVVTKENHFNHTSPFFHFINYQSDLNDNLCGFIL